MFDLEMMKEIGYCHGIENYSRHFSGRLPGEAPPTLLDYLPNDAVMFLDESHQTVPQLHGMYHGDRSRKEVLVAHGFRMPSALDNRPLTFEEFEHRVNQLVYVSATPGPYELTKSRRRGGGADHPADRTARPDGGDPARQRPGGRPAGANSRARGEQSARAGDDADQAHGGGPVGVLLRGRRALPVPALRRSRRWTASRFCAICGAASSTCWWESTCCAKGWICRRSRWWRFWMPIRKASCVPGAR